MDEQQRKPLISTEGEDKEPTPAKPRSGCLSNLLTAAGFIFLILIIFRSCGGDRDSEKTPKDSAPRITETETEAPPSAPPDEITSYEVTIILDYEEVPLTTNSPINICVDDTVLGRQDAGTKETYTVSLDKGEHKFYLKNDGLYSTSKLPFDVSDQQTSFQFGAKTRLTFGVEVWEESTSDSQPTSTATDHTAPISDGDWIDTCLAELGDYSLNVLLPQELYDVTQSYGYPGTRSDIEFLEGNLMLSVSAELIVHDSMVYSAYEQVGEDMDQTADLMFEAVCQALFELAEEQCADYGLQISKPVVETRTNGDTVWRVCTYTGSSKTSSLKSVMSHYFYMDGTLRAFITISSIISDNADSSELETFGVWVDVLQSSLEIEKNAQGTGQILGNGTDYVGTWEDIGGQSCILEIEPLPVDGYYSIHINWWAGTQYNIDWSYSGRFDGTMGGIECDHGTRTDYSPEASSEEVYSDSGTGWLRLTSDGRIEWENSSENLSKEFPDMTFLFQKSNT